MGERSAIALVSMPTLSGRFPSFQLALLKPTLERAGVPCQTFSLFMYFGRHVGWAENEALADVSEALLGEWIWARAAFPDDDIAEGAFGDDDAYRARFAATFARLERTCGVTFEDVRRLRDVAVPAFLDWCVESTDWSRFVAVGFSCVFQQNLASIALARRLKARFPDVVTLFGGSGFEDDIAEEIFRQCPFIDLLHCGDADLTLPQIARTLVDGGSFAGQRGLWWRDGGRAICEGRAPNLEELDLTPVPDFDEYFFAQEQSAWAAHAGTREVMLPIETARGCWWGERHHCTFCGLNRQGMAFRAKSPANVMELITTLATRYRLRTFDAIDNIVDERYVEAVFGALADEKSDFRFHYEVRPTLSRAKLKRMKDGGLYSVQPGIESLDTHVLTLMNKRTTGMKNLEFLKWTTAYGIHNLYNILHRFKGETLEDYASQVRTIARIPHLQPPKHITRARADRGSPMFETPEHHAISTLTPAAAYAFLYPRRFAQKKVSYYFEHRMSGVLDDDALRPLYDAVAAWQAAWRRPARPRLTVAKLHRALLVEDARAPHAHGAKEIVLDGRVARLYEALADAKRTPQLAHELEEDEAVIERDLQELAARDLVHELDGRWLALALPLHPGH